MLSNNLKAFENRKLLSASIWSAVFMESILKDILTVLFNVNVSTEEISSLIARLRTILNNGSSRFELTSTDSTAIENIMRRAEEIRLKRNCLVHSITLICCSESMFRIWRYCFQISATIFPVILI